MRNVSQIKSSMGRLINSMKQGDDRTLNLQTRGGRPPYNSKNSGIHWDMISEEANVWLTGIEDREEFSSKSIEETLKDQRKQLSKPRERERERDANTETGGL